MKRHSTRQRGIKPFGGTTWRDRFAARFRAALRADDRSQRELARFAGCREATISEVANGKRLPSVALLRTICLLHGHSADALLGLDQCPECGRTVDQTKAQDHCQRSAA